MENTHKNWPPATLQTYTSQIKIAYLDLEVTFRTTAVKVKHFAAASRGKMTKYLFLAQQSGSCQ